VLRDDAMYTPYTFDAGTGDLVGPAAGTCYSTIACVFHHAGGVYEIELRLARDLVPGGGCS
jgi:hypothetical protein